MVVVVPIWILMPVSLLFLVTKENLSLSDRIESVVDLWIIQDGLAVVEIVSEWFWIRVLLELRWYVIGIIVFEFTSCQFFSCSERSLRVFHFIIDFLLSWFQSIKISVKQFFLGDVLVGMSKPVASTVGTIDWVGLS